MANLLEITAKLVDMASRNKKVALKKWQVKAVFIIYGATKKQRAYFRDPLVSHARDVFGKDFAYTHDVLEFIQSLLESKL